MALVSLLGEKLAGPSGEVSTKSALADKPAVALYFSAHWCPPCRGFTPQLAKWYTDDLKAKGLEVVFVSSDRDEEAFASYFGEQPWFALPYAERELKSKLSKKFKVNGIPSLIILDGETGEVISKDGRTAVSKDPTGKNFPWRPPTVWEALGDEFLSGTDGDVVDIADLRKEAKVIGLYFSAHWCGPCRQFTPELVKAYEEHLKAKGLQVIFVSSDRDNKAFMEYYGTMPWLAIPNGDPRKETLSSLFEVRGIPTFALIDASTGEVITTDARSAVGADPTGKEFPYHPKPLVDMVHGDFGSINEETALVVMMEGCDKATQAKALEVLAPIAEKAKAAKAEMLYFYAAEEGGPTGQVRKLTKIGPSAEAKGKPQMLIMDIPDNGGYYVSEATEVTADTVNAFVEAYHAKALERKQMS